MIALNNYGLQHYLHSTLILKLRVWFFNAFRTLLYRPESGVPRVEWIDVFESLLLFLAGVTDATAAEPAAMFLRCASLREIWILGAPVLLPGTALDDDMVGRIEKN